MTEAEPLDLFYGVSDANLLASAGLLMPQIADATSPTATEPGVDL